MPAADRRPIIVVLREAGGHPPGGLAPIEAGAQLRQVDADGLGPALPGAEALLIWDFALAGALRGAWSRADALRWVHVAAAGLDTLLFDDLITSEVLVTNARGIFDRPMAEFALAAVLARAKRLPELRADQAAGVWRHRLTETVAGQAVLVVGSGSIGRATARLLRAAGLRVRGVGRTARPMDPDFGEIVPSDRLVEHAGWADHVVVVAPLTERTRGLIDERVLRAMRPTAHLVNLGRGPIVDEAALLAALRGGRIAAATLDVFDIEPLPPGHPLWTAPGVVVSPHLAGDGATCLDELAAQFVDNAGRWLAGAPLLNVVDKRLGFVPSSPGGGAP